MTTAKWLSIGVAVALAAAIAAVAWGGRSAEVPSGGVSFVSATDDQLQAAASTRTFFAHQSVGRNIIEGIPALYSSRGIEPPRVVESTDAQGTAVFEHTLIGTNGDPVGKIRAFDDVLRRRVGDSVDVAFVKLCYVDVKADSDVDAIFSEYRRTLAELERDYPHVTFLHLTVPLTTDWGLKSQLKSMVGKRDPNGPEHNVARERFNTLIREEYADTGRLFDIAALQSTVPDGERVRGDYEGQQYYALYEGYASDPGHLNTAGGTIAAEALMAAIAEASRA